MKKNSLLIFSLLMARMSIAQTGSGEPVFAPPMDIPISLAGNFMELRNSHFHSGLDMRTDGREGLDVKAAEDGWVSRVKISPWGYGKALYIEHPNGYTTVYGHLRNYVGTIADAVLEGQYKAREFEVDLVFEKGELPVKKGQVVANSGNTGGSSGPHLHFEVRRTSDQHALDPERFGMDVPDSTAPVFFGLRIDALDSLALVQPYPGKARGFVATNVGNNYSLKGGTEPYALGTVGLSVNVIDRYSNSWSTCGIRSLKVSVDGTPVFSAHLDEIDFGLQHYADAYMDYALFKGNDMNYNRCYKQPNNKLGIYGKEPAQGRITVRTGQQLKVLVEAVDANDNRSELRFTLRGATLDQAVPWTGAPVVGQYFRYGRENTLTTATARFTLPPNALYADERITCGSAKGTSPFAPITKLHDPLTPLNLAGQLSLKADVSKANGHWDKLLLVKLDENGKPSPIGGTYQDGWVGSKVKGFGDYTVMIDTLPPKVVALDLKPVMTGRDSIKIQVTDDLSGIDQWAGKLDGAWILFEYEPKKKWITHRFDKYSDKPGTHELVVEVHDERGNTSMLRTSFIR
jgi:hypothetical protein